MAIRSGGFGLAAWGYLFRSGLGDFGWVAFMLLVFFGLAFVVFDAWLLLAIALTGTAVGGWVHQLRQWPGFVFVPGFPQRLFALSVTIIVTATLLLSVAWWYSSRTLPAAGPALLFGLLMAYVRAGQSNWEAPFVVAVTIAGPLVFVGIAVDFRQLEAQPWLQVASRPDAQIAALAMAIVLAAMFRRLIGAPADANGIAVRDSDAWIAVRGFVEDARNDPSCGPRYIATWRAMAKLSMLCASFALAMDLLIRLVYALDDITIFSPLAIIVWPSVMMNSGVDFRGAWLAGAGRTRNGLAFRLVARVILAGALPMFAFLLAAEAVRSLVTRTDASFELLLVAQIVAFVLLLFCFAFRKRFPAQISGFANRALLLTTILWWVIARRLWLAEAQFGLEEYTTAILVLAASALIAFYTVARSLARADYLY